MKRAKAISQELAELGARALHWRGCHGGGRGSKIPGELWQEAIRLARVEGLYATAKATGFNFQRLKERCRKADGGADDKTCAAVAASASDENGADLLAADSKRLTGSRFVAVQLAPPRGGGQTTIELVGRHGDRMRVDVTGDVDVAGLVQTFWSRQS